MLAVAWDTHIADSRDIGEYAGLFVTPASPHAGREDYNFCSLVGQ